MSKKQQHDYYYSFTSPPTQEPDSSSSSRIPNPTAPPTTDTFLPPPSYDDALVPINTSVFQPAPPPNKPNFDGYVLDATSPPFNPNVILSTSMPTPDNNIPYNTSDYGQLDQNDNSIRPNVPLLSNGEANYNDNDDDQFRGRPAPPGYSLYRARYEIVRDGIISRDKHINQDGEALLQFLCQHNKPPRMAIHFYGKFILLNGFTFVLLFMINCGISIKKVTMKKRFGYHKVLEIKTENLLKNVCHRQSV